MNLTNLELGNTKYDSIKMRKHLIIFCIAIISQTGFCNCFAQGITMEATLEYINSKLQPVCQISVDRGILVSRCYEGETIIREDQVLCKSLELSSMNYDSKSKIFAINCNGTDKCVDRQMFVRRIQRDYARISFPVTLNASAESGMKKAFTHMIKLVLDPKYSSDEPFE